MDLMEMLKKPEYDFLRTDEHLGNRLILLGMGGSISYGTNQDTSDIDVRGIAVCGKKELLGLSQFEKFIGAFSCFQSLVNQQGLLLIHFYSMLI